MYMRFEATSEDVNHSFLSYNFIRTLSATVLYEKLLYYHWVEPSWLLNLLETQTSIQTRNHQCLKMTKIKYQQDCCLKHNLIYDTISIMSSTRSVKIQYTTVHTMWNYGQFKFSNIINMNREYLQMIVPLK